MKAEWIRATIEEVCNVDYGTRVTKKIDAGKRYPVYGGGGETFRVDSFNREDCMVIARFGMSERCTRFVSGKFFLNDSGLTLTPRNPSMLLPRFLGILILSLNNTIYSLGRGTAQKNLDVDAFRCFPIQFPPTPSEQKRIVAILDEAFEGIDRAVANAEKNLANARELFESHLNKVFTQKGDGWVEKPLGVICSIKHGFAFKSQFFTKVGNHILLTPGSFYESGGYREQGGKTKYYEGEIPEGYILEKGDFLFAMTEQAVGLLGSSLIVPEDNLFLHNQRLGLIQVNDGIEWHNDFFFHQFNTKFFRAAAQESASGIKVRHTSPTKLGNIPVYYPPTREKQEIIADTLNDLLLEAQRLKSIYQRKLTALAELKQSLLQKAFAGELTANDTAINEEAVA